MAVAGLTTCWLMGLVLNKAVTGSPGYEKGRGGTKVVAGALLLPLLIMLGSIAAMLMVMGAVILEANPIVWMGDFLAKDSFLCTKVCAYWIMQIAVFVIFAQFANEVLRWRQIIVRKVFHAAVLALFVPAILLAETQRGHDGTLHSFLSLAFAVVLCIFILIEYVRVFMPISSLLGRDPFSAYYSLFLDERDRGRRFIFSHLYLIVGVAIPIWLSSLHIAIESGKSSHDEKWLFVRHFSDHVGLITVGAGDASAAAIGSTCGHTRWSRSNKRTVEGSCAMLIASAIYTLLLYSYEAVTGDGCIAAYYEKYWPAVAFALLGATFAEAFTNQNDNVVLPICTLALLIGVLQIFYN